MDSKSYIKKLSNNWSVDHLKIDDDTSLRYGLFRNSEVPMRRCVVYINGRTEWIEKNMEIPDWLDLPEDCGYLTWDLRGQGASSGERSWIDSYDTYVTDAVKIIDNVLGPDIPTAIVSHSTGSLIALYGALKGDLKPTSIVASSALLGLRNKPVPRILARPTAKLLTCLQLGTLTTGVGTYDKKGFEANKLTHDYDMYHVIQDSPYRVPSARFGWVNATFDALAYTHSRSNIAKLSAPTLLLVSGEERVVDSDFIFAWSQTAQQHAKVPVQADLIHGGRHELFSETPQYRDQAVAKTKAWLQSFLS